VGGVIIKGTSNVPIKNGGAIPPRNAVYVFKADGDAPFITGFIDTPLAPSTHPVPSSVFVQCFNHVEASSQFTPPTPHFIDPDPFDPEPLPPGSMPVQRYYCGFDDQSNLGGRPFDSCAEGAQCGTIPNDQNKNIKGKICNTTTSMLEKTKGRSIFGACN
jgi:hypothetical protein